QRYGFAAMEQYFVSGRHCDSVLSMAFGANRDEQHAIQCLTSYLQELQSTSEWILIGSAPTQTLAA
ncbi:hypothetical protein SB912_25140, partial [Pantoea sp. SIMBA_072]